jgi:ubiquinone/menaquinone biosynthesis C-methylase UbiE
MSNWDEVLPVGRPRIAAARSYDRLSSVYDLISWPFERSVQLQGLELLSPAEGESILELGCGTGQTIARIAHAEGITGMAYGVDISRRMVDAARRRTLRRGLLPRTYLAIGDATHLPFGDDVFDAAYMGFTLELFDTREMLEVLAEVRRVLRPGGRLCAVSMSRAGGSSPLVRMYEWVHATWPSTVDCRPIHVQLTIERAGFRKVETRTASVFGIPVEIVLGQTH